MKQTVFEIESRIIDGESTTVLEAVREQLLAIAPVLSVEMVTEGSFSRFEIAVEFEDAASAKSLHRKIMKLLMDSEGISIRQVTTRLGDIF